MAKNERHTFNTKVYEVAGNDPVKPTFQCVYFKGGFAYASDGYVCIKQTLQLQGVMAPECLEGKALHRDSYKDVMGFEMAECNDAGIECWNANGQRAFFEYYELPDGLSAPNFENFLKSVKGQKQLDFIGIEPGYFARVCSALYAPGNNIRLQFTGIDTLIIVDAIGVDDQIATMMPKILEGTLF